MLRINSKPSLYRDFALLSAMIVFLLFLLSMWVSYKTFEEHAIDTLEKLENESVRIDRALIIEIERASYLLESIARQISAGNSDDLSNISQLFESFDKSSHPSNSEFSWINAEQKIVLSSGEGKLDKPIDVSDRDYMKQAITTPWAIHIGQPMEDHISGKWVMPIVIGLTDSENHFKGALAISLDINSFSREIHSVIQQPGVSFVITNTAFTILTEISEQPHFFENHFDFTKLAAIDFRKNSRGTYSSAELFDRKKIFAYYEKSSQYPYIIFVGFDTAISNDIVRGVLLPRLAQIMIITIFLVSILWTVRKRIIQPVIALTERTADIVRGKEFVVQEAGGPLEIESLAIEIARIYSFIVERRRIEHELSAKNSELMKIRESAEMTNEIKAEFFEQVGSALMQPASAVSEYADSLRNELFGPFNNNKYNEISEKLHWQASIIIDLLNDVLMISRAESGLLSLQESTLELPLIIKKCIRLLHERSRYQSIEIVQDYDDNLPQLRADEMRIKQLLLNLMSGAAAQLRAGDIIRIRTSQHRDGLTIRMEYTLPFHHQDDEMPIMPLESSPSFNMSAPQSSGNMSEPSAGLGFALNQLIVAMHGGTIAIKSGQDRKVTVTVVFPPQRMAGNI